MAQVGDGADVGVLWTVGVGAGALEQHQLSASGVAGGAYGGVEFVEAGHAGGDDQRLTSGGFFDQRQVVVLEAGELVGGGAEVFQEVDGGFTKRRAEADQAQLAGALHDWTVTLPGGWACW